MPRLDETRCRQGSPLNRMFTADEAATIKRFINSFQVRLWNGREPYVDRSHPFGEYTIYLPRSSGAAFPWSKVSFGWSLADGVVTVYAGRLHIHGIGVVSFVETEVTLLAETCTIYAHCARGSLANGTIAVSASPAATSNTHYRFPLYTFTYDTESETYETPPRIHHFGDLHLDAPVM
jgi:hypothetical protein